MMFPLEVEPLGGSPLLYLGIIAFTVTFQLLEPLRARIVRNLMQLCFRSPGVRVLKFPDRIANEEDLLDDRALGCHVTTHSDDIDGVSTSPGQHHTDLDRNGLRFSLQRFVIRDGSRAVERMRRSKFEHFTTISGEEAVEHSPADTFRVAGAFAFGRVAHCEHDADHEQTEKQALYHWGPPSLGS